MTDLTSGFSDGSAKEEGKASSRLIDADAYPVRDVMDILLRDRTTVKNILWATDAHSSCGPDCSDKSHIDYDAFNRENGDHTLAVTERRCAKTIGSRTGA